MMAMMMTMMMMMRMTKTAKTITPKRTTTKTTITKTTMEKMTRKKTTMIKTKTFRKHLCFHYFGFFCIGPIICTPREVEWYPVCGFFSLVKLKVCIWIVLPCSPLARRYSAFFPLDSDTNPRKGTLKPKGMNLARGFYISQELFLPWRKVQCNF